MMRLAWQWPWAAVLALALTALTVLFVAWMGRRRDRRDAAGAAADADRVFSLDDDLNTERASHLFRLWRALSRLAAALLAASIALAATLVARPGTVDRGEERASSRDIVLCLDVSGSTLPYDRQVIDTYLQLVEGFRGERIGMSIFNSTSRTVFPLTDDYELVSSQLKAASEALHGVESQDDIDAMSDEDYQRIADWLEGTQNRTDTTSLIGDGVVSCAAMLPGFAYGSDTDGERTRAASIVLATDNVVSGTPVYTLAEALDLADQAHIDVDGLFSGPTQSESETATQDMKELIEAHGGVFLTQSGGDVSQLVRQIESRRDHEQEDRRMAAMVDDPKWWALALCVAVVLWLLTVWRLKR